MECGEKKRRNDIFFIMRVQGGRFISQKNDIASMEAAVRESGLGKKSSGVPCWSVLMES